jgi:hypothetical protein
MCDGLPPAARRTSLPPTAFGWAAYIELFVFLKRLYSNCYCVSSNESIE